MVKKKTENEQRLAYASSGFHYLLGPLVIDCLNIGDVLP